MSLKLSSDWAKVIVQALNIPVVKIEALFEIGEDENGWFYAKRKKSTWLELNQFKTLCSVAKDYGGDYSKPENTWRVPGPYVKKPEQAATPEPKPKPVDIPRTPEGASPISPSTSQDVKKQEQTTSQPTPFQMASVNALFSMPFQSRTTEDSELAELVESVKTYGLLEPILVGRKPSGVLEVVAGERRLAAAKQAGLTEIPVIIKQLTDKEACEIQLIENVQRKDLADIEKARMLDYMIKQFGYTQEQLAKKLGKTQGWLSQHLSMLKIPENITRVIKPEQLTEHQAREILAAPEEKREALTKQIAETGEVPSSREIHKAMQPEPVTTSIPSASMESALPESGKPEPEPRPEPVDVADFTCSVCNREFRIVHVAHNLHRFEPIRK